MIESRPSGGELTIQNEVNPGELAQRARSAHLSALTREELGDAFVLAVRAARASMTDGDRRRAALSWLDADELVAVRAEYRRRQYEQRAEHDAYLARVELDVH